MSDRLVEIDIISVLHIRSLRLREVKDIISILHVRSLQLREVK